MKLIIFTFALLLALLEAKTTPYLSAEHPFVSSTVCQTPDCIAKGYSLKSNLDQTVDPCHDFYAFACGGWDAKHNVTTDGQVSVFGLTQEEILNSLMDRMTKNRSQSDPESVVYASGLFTSCIDQENRDSIGVKPLKELLVSLGGWPLAGVGQFDESKFQWRDQLPRLMALLPEQVLFKIGVSLDYSDPTYRKRMLSFTPQQMDLPEKLEVQGKFFEAYKKLFQRTVALIRGQNDNQTLNAIDEVIDFQYRIQDVYYGFVDLNNSRVTFNDFNQRLNNSVDWLQMTNKLYETLDSSIRMASNDTVMVDAPNWFQKVPQILDETPKHVLANYFGWLVAFYLAPYTSSEFKNITDQYDIDRFGIILLDEPPITKCFKTSEKFFNYAIGRLYVHDFVDKNHKNLVSQLVNDIEESFVDLMEENNWLEAETKQRALTKLKAITRDVDYQDWIVNDTVLDAKYNLKQKPDPRNYFNNMLYLTKKLSMDQLNSLTVPLEYIDYGFSVWLDPYTVNAQYSPYQNAISMLYLNVQFNKTIFPIDVPAGMLSKQYYGANLPGSFNYAVGAVIGHEFTHAFDNRGSKYNENGTEENWWSDADQKRFDDRALCFEKEYNNTLDQQTNEHLNGQISLGENIADNGGLREAFRAYQKYIARGTPQQRLPVIDSYTAEQQFFISYANIYCNKYDTEALKLDLKYAEHSAGRYRVNIPLSNFFVFNEVFKCSANSTMNRKDKCVMW